MRLVHLVIISLGISATLANDLVDKFVVTPSDLIELVSDEGALITLEMDEELDINFILGTFKDIPDEESLSVSGPGKDYFDVQKVNGVWKLMIVIKIDYDGKDANQEFKLIISKKSDEINFLINIRNTNDNPMILRDAPCKFPERNKIGETTTCTYTISDEDGVEFDKIKLLQTFVPPGRFKMTEILPEDQGKLSVNVSLIFLLVEDYEKEKRIVQTWSVEDAKYKDSMTIIIDIDDVADEAPVWNKQIGSITLAEHESHTEANVTATDGDAGIKSPISYAITCDDTNPDVKKICEDNIKIDSAGNIKIEPIDRDEKDLSQIVFTVVAKEDEDKGGMNATQKIVLLIEDINDNRPKISEFGLAYTKPEGFSDVLIADIEMDDIDKGEFATYDISLSSSLKSLDINKIMKMIPDVGYRKNTFSLSVIDGKQLDYDRQEELQKSFTVTIKVDDHPSNPVEVPTRTITITLENINDESPEFQEESYEVTIAETFGRKEEEVLIVPGIFYAVDDDVGDKVTYEILGTAAKNILEISKQPGPKENIAISTKKQGAGVQLFDFETQPDVIVSIKARDNFPGDSTPPKTRTVQLTINLTDVNDETPTLRASKQIFSIAENQVSDWLGGIELRATDPDTGAKLSMIIDQEKSYGTKNAQVAEDFDLSSFELADKPEGRAGNNELTKIIKLVKKLDFDKVVDTVYLYIVVTDEDQDGDNTAAVTVTITVENVNDNPPIFDKIDLMSIKEHSNTDALIGVVKAQDLDNNNITYRIISQDLVTEDGKHVSRDENEASLVKIDPSGKILVDADKAIDADPNIKQLKLVIEAFDGEHRTEQPVEITITDINDQKPEFTILEELQIAENFNDETNPENIPIRTFDVTDTDRDATNYQFECIVTSGKDVFSATAIDKTCQVYAKKGANLNRETLAQYTITVHTYNHLSNEELRVSQEVTINVLDVNDNEPKLNPNQKFSISEHDVVDTDMGTMSGSDLDDGPNGQFTFELISVIAEESEDTENITRDETNIASFFTLSPEGKLSLAQDLNNKDHYGDHLMTIKLQDKGEPPLSSVDNIAKLNIQPYNYNPIKFEEYYQNILVLRTGQEVDTPLLIHSGDLLNAIKVNDGQSNSKYKFTFDIKDGATPEAIFTLNHKQNLHSVDLRLKTKPTDEDKKFQLTIVAQCIDCYPIYAEAELDLTVYFLNSDAKPMFDPTECMSSKIDEDVQDPFIVTGLHDAVYLIGDPSGGGIDLGIYYQVLEESKPSKDYYEVSETKPITLTVKKPLNILDHKEHYAVIQALPDKQRNGRAEDRSKLKVTIDLVDINNNPPVFAMAEDSFAVIETNVPTPIVIEATDRDEGQQEPLKYRIDWTSYQVFGENLPPANQRPFDLGAINGQLTHTFTVNDNMRGNIQFKVIAYDGKFETPLQLTCYVISVKHITIIQFENTVDQIKDKIPVIEEILRASFVDYTIGVYTYQANNDNDNQLSGVADGDDEDDPADTGAITNLFTYFIDKDGNGVEKDVIKSKMNDIQFYDQLRREFSKESLLLKHVNSEAVESSLEETYKVALIVVAVVAGVLLIGLIAFFTYKIRSQANRLDRLEHAEARRPTAFQIPNLPGANRRATQCVNPAIVGQADKDDASHLSFNSSPRTSHKDLIDDDDDEDFIGVENNDIFKIGNENTKF